MTAGDGTVRVRLFAAAAEAAGTEETTARAGSLAELRAVLVAGFGDGFDRVWRRCSFLVDGVSADADAPLAEGVTVDVLPPFAGG